MTLTQMQYFDAVCRHESYTKAAQELLVSQPAISQSMRELEAECGTPLFARQGNTLTVTQQGKLLQEEVRQVLEQIQHLHHVIHDLGMTRNFVRIGLSTIFGNTVFPRLRREFHRRYPDIETISYENVTPSLFEMLDAGKVDLLITTPSGYASPECLAKHYHVYPLHASQLKFCVHKHHPLASRGSVTLEEIAAEPLAMLESHYAPTRIIQQLFREQGLPLHVIHYTSQIYTLERFVEQGAAAGFLPGEISDYNANIVGLDYPGQQPQKYTSLVWKKKSVQYESVKKFIASTKELFPITGK